MSYGNMPWDQQRAYGIRSDGTYGPMDGGSDNAYAAVDATKAGNDYYDQLAGLIDESYATANDALRRKYAGAARFRNANLDVNMTKAGTYGSPTMQALNDVYTNQGNKAMGADEVSLEAKRISAQVSAMQQKINYLIEQGRLDEAKKLQQEQADAAAWGNILQAGATGVGFLLGGVPGAIIGGAAGGTASGLEKLSAGGGVMDEAYINSIWNSPDTVSNSSVVTDSPYVNF